MTFQPNQEMPPPPDSLRTKDPELHQWLTRHYELTWRVWFPKQRALGAGVEYDDQDRITVDVADGDCCPTLLPAYDFGSVADAEDVTEDYGSVAAPVLDLVDLGSVAS